MNARPANRRLISRAAPVLLALVGLAILFAAVPTTAESSGPGKPPDTPEGLEGTAIFVGGVDLEWTDVPGAESYEVQLFRNVQWIDLPGDGVEIAFYGAGAIISQLNHDGYTYWFQVRANNAKGSSEWSDPYLMQPTYHFEAGRKERPENVVATGAPTISGTAQVGKVLTADASGIEDGNGLDRVKFQYQWVSNDGTTDTDIEGATESAYRLQAADEGKTLKVRGSFIDRHGYAESLTSAATPAALESAANIAPTGAPAISGPTHVSGTLTASVQGIDDQNGLRHAAFRYRWTATDGTIETVVQDSEKPIYVLAEADEGKTVQVDATFTDDDGYEETLLSVPTGAIGPRPNRPATGEPTINGTVQVGETLTADTSGIKDADGINRDRVRFQFKWIANDGVTDTELSYGPGNSGFPNYTTYTLTVDDAGKTIRVQVEFNDGRGHRETVTSAPSPQVSPGPNIPATGVPTISGAPKVGRTLTVDASGISDPNGLDPAAFSHQWVVSDGATDTYIAGADDSTYTAIADDTGKTIHVRVTFTDKGGYQESVTSAATVPVFETDDHGDTPETATPLPVDIPNSNPTQGTVYPRDDYDYFRLEVTDENSGYIKVSFYEWEDSDPDPSLFYARLALFNGDGTCVTRLCDLDNGTDAGYLQAYVQPGVYYLRITGPHHDLDTDSVGANRGYYVFWARDQHYYDRLEECRDSSSGFDDPLFGCQGHLKADDDYDEYPGSDINVVPAWEAGHFGAGINVVVVDTGIDDQHQDLVGVVVVGKSGKTEHLPRLYDPRSQHGTKVAGIIAAQHNTVGVRGIAPEATIYSFRLFQDSSFREWSTNPYESRTSQTLGDPLTLHHTDVAVSNNSWGTGLLGYVPGEMDELRTQSLLKGINEGFHGKGTLYVFSAIDEDGNLWELSSHYAVIQVCGVGPDGKKSIHEGHGYNLWMCAPLGGYTTHNNNYYGGAVGTSFSAPHVSGVAALVRSADMELTWRDVKLILAGSAVKNDPDHAGWEAGALKYGSTTETYSFNPNYGFGVVDAKAAVDLAATWTNLPPMQTASANSGNTNLAIPDPPNSGTPTTVETSVTLEDDGHSTPLFTEHVEIEVKFDHPSFRDLDVELVSPTGTVSKLASHDNDLRGGVFDFEYSFGSSKHLGENPVGTWTLRITDHVSRYQGQLKEWSVIVRGHRPEAVSGPHIVGTPQVRETLTVDTSGIDDEDGLVNVSFSYQWLANDAEIVGATDPTYTLVDDDAGLTIKVQVSFFDDKNNPDTLTSAATTAVLANVPDEPEHLNVSLRDTGALDVSWEAPASDGGSAITEYRVQWKEIAGNWDAPADVSEETATGTTHTITGLTDGVEYAVRVIVANNVGEGPPSDEATGTPRETTPPELSTATVDGATLTLTYDEDLDENSEPSSDAFSVTVVGTGRAVDGVSVSGSSVILTLGSVVTSEDTVTVSYTVPTDAAAPQIQDDAGNPAASFSDQDVEDNTPPPANTPATGAPTITGTAQVGDTLTVETSAIDDADGLDNVGYSYQWLADDTEIAGATDPTYTLVDADAGLTIKVKVSFFDDKNNQETLTSEATATVVTPLTAEFRDVPDKHLGTGVFTFDIAFSEPISIGYVTLRDDSLEVTNGSATKAKRVDGQSDLWEITVEPDSDADVTVVLPITKDCAAQDAVCTRDGTKLSNRSELTVPGPAAANSPATGAPIISGTAEVGETLTVDTSGIEDADGMSGAVFSYQWLANDAEITGATSDTYTLVEADFDKAVKVRVIFNDDDDNEETLTSETTASVAPRPNTPATGLPTITGTAQVGETLTVDTSGIGDDDGLPAESEFDYQWIAGTTDISGATGSTYTLVDDDAGLTIKVKVSFFDDKNNQETLTSEATATVVTPLTAEFQDAPPSHNGSDTFTFRIAFSEPISISYKTLRDDSLDVTNGSATKAKRVDGQSDLWEITVEPDSDAAVTVVLPITEDCAAQDAVCTRDGTELSNRSELTVPGPAAANSPATGAPIISGTARVGETLTVDTSGIEDADGMSGAVFSYQWLADGVEITGATSDTYTLVEADFNKAVKVRVIFNDDDDNEETLTSEPTAAVAAETAAPDAPRSLNVSQDDTGTLDVSWEAPASDGGSAITGYKVQWKRVGDSWDTPADVFEETVSRMTHTITGLTDGVEYAVRVIAVNDVGDGPPSDEATGTPRETTPPELATATVDGRTLTLTYDEDLDENSEPSSDAFSVAVVGTGRAVDGVSVAGDTVTLTLASAVTAADTVTVSYTAPADTAAPRIQDEAGNPAASFSDQGVENNTPPPANTPATGAPTISGTVRVGETLTAGTSAIADADGMSGAVFIYHWLANGADVAGATNNTYTLVDTDVGKTIKVRVIFTDNADNEETLTSAATAAVEPRPNTPATGAPTISGTAQVGETLTVDTSGIADADGMSGAVFIYHWLANGADVAGATSDTYTPVADDFDKAIKVKVSFRDDRNHQESLTSAATAAVTAAADESAVWSATLTVGSSGSFHGYWNDFMGSLAPDGFNIDGSDYTVTSLSRYGDLMFAFVLDQALPGDFTLQVGDTTLRSEEAEVTTSSSSYSYQWQNKIPALSDGDIVEVSLTLAE